LRTWWAERDGADAVWRVEIQPSGTGSLLRSDLFNRVTSELVEAKADSSESIRMAIGQLADYRRFVDRRRLQSSPP
jgi:hypothetical protein